MIQEWIRSGQRYLSFAAFALILQGYVFAIDPLSQNLSPYRGPLQLAAVLGPGAATSTSSANQTDTETRLDSLTFFHEAGRNLNLWSPRREPGKSSKVRTPIDQRSLVPFIVQGFDETQQAARRIIQLEMDEAILARMALVKKERKIRHAEAFRPALIQPDHSDVWRNLENSVILD